MTASLVVCQNKVVPADIPGAEWSRGWKSKARQAIVYGSRPWVWSVVRDRSAKAKGIITELFSEVLARLRAGGESWAFLMVSKSEGLEGRYQGLGFKRVNEFVDPGDGPSLAMGQAL